MCGRNGCYPDFHHPQLTMGHEGSDVCVFSLSVWIHSLDDEAYSAATTSFINNNKRERDS